MDSADDPPRLKRRYLRWHGEMYKETSNGWCKHAVLAGLLGDVFAHSAILQKHRRIVTYSFFRPYEQSSYRVTAVQTARAPSEVLRSWGYVPRKLDGYRCFRHPGRSTQPANGISKITCYYWYLVREISGKHSVWIVMLSMHKSHLEYSTGRSPRNDPMGCLVHLRRAFCVVGAHMRS